MAGCRNGLRVNNGTCMLYQVQVMSPIDENICETRREQGGCFITNKNGNTAWCATATAFGIQSARALVLDLVSQTV